MELDESLRRGPVSVLEDWGNSPGWMREGRLLVRRGGKFVLAPIKPGPGTYVQRVHRHLEKGPSAGVGRQLPAREKLFTLSTRKELLPPHRGSGRGSGAHQTRARNLRVHRQGPRPSSFVTPCIATSFSPSVSRSARTRLFSERNKTAGRLFSTSGSTPAPNLPAADSASMFLAAIKSPYAKSPSRRRAASLLFSNGGP